MALADPQSITVGSATSLARILTGTQDASYSNADNTIVLRVSHTVNKNRKLSLVSLSRKKTVTDDITDMKSQAVATLNLTFIRPITGFTEAELLELSTGVTGWGTASTNANFKAVLALQS